MLPDWRTSHLGDYLPAAGGVPMSRRPGPHFLPQAIHYLHTPFSSLWGRALHLYHASRAVLEHKTFWDDAHSLLEDRFTLHHLVLPSSHEKNSLAGTFRSCICVYGWMGFLPGPRRSRTVRLDGCLPWQVHGETMELERSKSTRETERARPLRHWGWPCGPAGAA